MKHKITFHLSLFSILLSGIFIFPNVAKAGPDVIFGTTSDSSGTVGDTFGTTVITPNVTTRVESVQISKQTINGTVILVPTQTTQIKLNQFATSLFKDSTSSSRMQVRELFTRRGRNAVTVTEKIKRDWVSYGLQANRIEVFLVKLSECITVVGISSESEDRLFVDVNKLSAAIEDYNLLIKENNSSVLQKLVQDENFMEISNILKDLRSRL